MWGGSSFGYKLAGYEVLGNVEIDPKVNEVYVRNHHPKHNYCMDIREFNRLPDSRIPKELFELSILDGSPPCTTFSMAGDREKTWGKVKKFAEGQKEQMLDTLFFDFIETAKRLQPKVIVAENVDGLLRGNAMLQYAQTIKYEMDAADYNVQVFRLDASKMGVPQRRVRVFYIARRKELGMEDIRITAGEKPIPFGKVREKHGQEFAREDSLMKQLMRYKRPTDRDFRDINVRLGYKDKGFTNGIIHDAYVAPTLTASGTMVRYCDDTLMSPGDMRNVSTFPQDYEIPEESRSKAQFLYGMSVPPVMMAHIAAAIYEQWLSKA